MMPGGSWSMITFTQAGLPLSIARWMAGPIWSGYVTYSPWPPMPSTILS